VSITGQDAPPSVPLHQGLAVSIPNQAAKIIPSLLSWVQGELAMENVLRSHQPLPDGHAGYPSGLEDCISDPWSLVWKPHPRAPAVPCLVPGDCQKPSTFQPQTHQGLAQPRQTGCRQDKQRTGRAPCQASAGAGAGGQAPINYSPRYL